MREPGLLGEKHVGNLPSETRASLRVTAEDLARACDLPRLLLEAYRILQPGGLLRLEVAPRGEERLTTWTELFAELLFPHLGALRAARTAACGEGGRYVFSPATLRSAARRLFGDRLAVEASTPQAGGGFHLLCRKRVPVGGAFPWRISGAWPEMEVRLGPAGHGGSLCARLDVVSPLPCAPAAGKGGPVAAARLEPGLSVVMATRNARATLPGALAALAAQTRPPLELVVQDGGSTDGTPALLEAFAGRALFPVRLDSRPDRGVYEAWNRALGRVGGSWVLFLGADDAPAGPDVLARALPLLEDLDGRIEVAYGGLILCRGGTEVDAWAPQKAKALARMRSGMGLPFPATFIRTSVFCRRRFDPSYRIAGDYRLLAEVAAPRNLARLPFAITRMELGGLSSSPKYHTLTEAERIRVVRELGFSPR